MTVSVNGTNGLTFNDGSSQNTSPFTGGFGFRNRIINGNFVIDQRNAGASVTANDGTFAVDRFKFNMQNNSTGTGQQSTTAPAGFKNSLVYTSSAATSVGASDTYGIIHDIEGLNCADLAWGTADAATVVLSFKVRSSLTGIFGGVLKNSAANRAYPFTYTISSANTWTNISITIAGDTSGTWLTTNGIGIRVVFGLGNGSSASATAGAWTAGNYWSATGAVQVVATSGATFYITGVQLEKGSTATSFDYRPYGTELALCRRYFTKYYQNTTGVTNDSGVFTMANWNGTEAYGVNWYQVSMRSAPSFSYSALSDFTWYNSGSSKTPTSIDQQGASIDRCEMKIQWSGSITAGTAGWMRISSASSGGWISWSAEL